MSMLKRHFSLLLLLLFDRQSYLSENVRVFIMRALDAKASQAEVGEALSFA